MGAPAPCYFGTAGWALPTPLQPLFPGGGTHLERYARELTAVEINSSFYRPHQAKTYARWAQSVPSSFRFSVKLSRAFTHEARLRVAPAALRESLAAPSELGEKFGALLVQLPPSLRFDPGPAEEFLARLAELSPAPQVWEPRHPTWATEEALSLLERYGAAKVIADPEPCPARELRTARSLVYRRLHGSLEMYRSRYSAAFLRRLAAAIAAAPAPTQWCIFDNTTFGYALENALDLTALLRAPSPPRKASSARPGAESARW